MSEHGPIDHSTSGGDAGPAQSSGASDAPRDNPAGDSPVQVLTLVCENCGKDYFFDNEPPEPGLRCEKCGGTVFRSYYDNAGDEAADDFRDTTERDLDPDDAEGDVLPGDVIDLNNV